MRRLCKLWSQDARFSKKYGTQKELNVVIEDAVKEALKKAKDTSSGDASSEELEVFNASNNFCMLKSQPRIQSQNNKNINLLWCQCHHHQQ